MPGLQATDISSSKGQASMRRHRRQVKCRNMETPHQDCGTHLFDDLLHQCPALSATLADLPRQSLSALLATSHCVRDQISAVLQGQRCLGFRSFPRTGLTMYQAWPALRYLSVSYLSTPAATYLVNSSLPQLCLLMVFAPPISLQTAAKVAEGNWHAYASRATFLV